MCEVYCNIHGCELVKSNFTDKEHITTKNPHIKETSHNNCPNTAFSLSNYIPKASLIYDIPTQTKLTIFVTSTSKYI